VYELFLYSIFDIVLIFSIKNSNYYSGQSTDMNSCVSHVTDKFNRSISLAGLS